MKNPLLLLPLILLTACGGTGPAFDTSETPSSASSATLVIYRPSSFIGSALSPATFINGDEKCDLPSGSFYYASVPAGNLKVEYLFTRPSNKLAYGMNVQADHTYYIRISPDKAQILGGEFGAAGSLAASDNQGPYNIQLVDKSQALHDLQSTKQTMSCK